MPQQFSCLAYLSLGESENCEHFQIHAGLVFHNNCVASLSLNCCGGLLGMVEYSHCVVAGGRLEGRAGPGRESEEETAGILPRQSSPATDRQTDLFTQNRRFKYPPANRITEPNIQTQITFDVASAAGLSSVHKLIGPAVFLIVS